MSDELQARLAFLEKRLTVLEREVAGLKAARPDAPTRAPVILPYHLPADAAGMLIANGYDIDASDRSGKWRWVGNDGPIQFVLPFGLAEAATARILLANHPKVDLEGLRVFVNDKLVAHRLEADAGERRALIAPIEASPHSVNIVLDGVKSVRPRDIHEGEDTRPLAFKFFGMEILAGHVAAQRSDIDDDALHIGAMRLDERLPLTGEYRHLDISLLDLRFQRNHWDNVKFKIASFKGETYLEFRKYPNAREIFHAWPGTEEDHISKLFKLPDPMNGTAPTLADARDLAMLKLLLENLDMIVGGVTNGSHAPSEEIEFWRGEARALASRTLRLLSGANQPTEAPETVADGALRVGGINLDGQVPLTDDYRHLDISLFDAALSQSRWDRVKFKLANFRGHSYLEFRSPPAAPEVFHIWPGQEEDAVGKLAKFPDAKGDFPAFADADDAALAKILFVNLEEIVQLAAESSEELAFWLAEAQGLAQRAQAAFGDQPGHAAPSAGPETLQAAFIRLDDRHPPVGEYRHIDISLFDARLKTQRWEQIKFKFASYKGRNYLEFRNPADMPRVFHVWPGNEEDAHSGLLKIPAPDTEKTPEISDPRDREAMRALIANLDQIVRAATAGMDAPPEEVELWRAEAQSFAERILPQLSAQ